MTVRVFAINTSTRAIIAEIPFSSLSLTHRLNDVGSWQMELPMSFTSPNGTEVLTVENFDVNKSSVVIIRDGLPLMMGLIEEEDGEITEDDEKLTIGGPELAMGYLSRRLYLSSTAFNTDQFTIASSIIAAAGPPFGMIIPVTKEPGSLSGVVRQRTYRPSERKYAYELLSELAAVENGFDFAATITGTQATVFSPGIVLGYPQLYRRTGFTLATKKNISKIEYVKDGKRYANFVQVGGADKSEYTLPTTAQNAGDLGSYLYFMKTESRPTVTDQATLLDHANRYLRLYERGVTEWTFTVDTSDPDCQVGSFRVGDEFVVRAQKGRVDLDTLMRVSEWSFSVNEDGDETLRMTMVETGALS